jgi:hypothetical protein
MVLYIKKNKAVVGVQRLKIKLLLTLQKTDVTDVDCNVIIWNSEQNN